MSNNQSTIQSMTAFARTQTQADWGNLVCEIRSINHRYLEISLHLPEGLRVLEMPIRELIRQYVKRGKIECGVRYQAAANNVNQFSINTAIAEELCQASEKIASFLKSPAPIHPVDILKFQGVLETKETDIETLHKQALSQIEKTLKELVLVREREGRDLCELFMGRMNAIRDELNKVRLRQPQAIKDAHDRLVKRFTDAKLDLDSMRLEQEMVMYAQKIDIAEEIDRTETHVNEIRRILQAGGMVGRRLDFLLQELNREANTLGSKSVDSIVTHAAVEMKVLIEQVREQVQNVE